MTLWNERKDTKINSDTDILRLESVTGNTKATLHVKVAMNGLYRRCVDERVSLLEGGS